MDINSTNLLLDLRTRIALSTVTQEQVAAAIGMNSAQFSRVLRGIRPIPKTMPHFLVRVEEAVQRAEAAEQAAQGARQQTLGSSDLTLASKTEAQQSADTSGEKI